MCKAEEQAILNLPPDFDLLELDDIPGADDLDDNARRLEAQLFKQKIAELLKRRALTAGSTRKGQGQGQRRKGQVGVNPAPKV